MKKTNSLTITSRMEVLQQIGKQLSETGLGVPASTEQAKELEKQVILKQVPVIFRVDGSEYLELRSQEIHQKMMVSRDFQIEKGIDGVAIDLLQTFVVKMEPCLRDDIALALERIASTFQCKVPDEFGLTQYFNILELYPKFCIEYATDTLLSEYKYPRLPVPKDFVDICQPMYEEHKEWLLKTAKRFHALELFRQQGGIKNKYLDNKDET